MGIFLADGVQVAERARAFSDEVAVLGEKGKDGSYSDPYDTANYNTFVVM